MSSLFVPLLGYMNNIGSEIDFALESKMSMTTSSSVEDMKRLCHCNLPPRTCTSKTKDNPGKKFRVCPNSLKPGKKCHYWEWVEEGSAVKTPLEDEIATIKEEVLALKKEVAELRKTARTFNLMFVTNTNTKLINYSLQCGPIGNMIMTVAEGI
ncbi:hypothetical protein LXL04_002911 [Taraxacum kok-saghyz]